MQRKPLNLKFDGFSRINSIILVGELKYANVLMENIVAVAAFYSAANKLMFQKSILFCINIIVFLNISWISDLFKCSNRAVLFAMIAGRILNSASRCDLQLRQYLQKIDDYKKL